MEKFDFLFSFILKFGVRQGRREQPQKYLNITSFLFFSNWYKNLDFHLLYCSDLELNYSTL